MAGESTREIGFALHQKSTKTDKAWPPFTVEWVWCSDFEGDLLVVRTPFFVKGVSAGDVISVTRNDEDFVTRYRSVRRSSNTTLWIKAFQPGHTAPLLQKLNELGCRTFSLPQLDYHAVEVPERVAIADVDALVDALDPQAAVFAFPSFRHISDDAGGGLWEPPPKTA